MTLPSVLNSVWALSFTLCSLGAMAREGDELRPVLQCLSTGSLRPTEPQRLPASVRSRSVSLPGGEKSVSLADGYRLMLSTAQGLHFVNLKIERSEPGSAAADRAVLREQMAAFEAKGIDGAPPLRDERSEGLQLLGLDQPGVEGHGALGFYTLLQAERGLVATVVFLNQEPARRAFQDQAGYAALRDSFLADIRRCMKFQP
jgi:hypothetical protein